MSRVSSLLLPFSLFLCVLPASSMQLRQASPLLQQLLRQDIVGERAPGRLAVEITGCLQTFNTTEIQNSFHQNIKAIKQAGLAVDIFAVLQSCNPERDEVIVPYIADMFNRACGEVESMEKGCLISVDLLPANTDLLAAAAEQVPEEMGDRTKLTNVNNLPPHADLYMTGDSGAVFTSIKETDAYRLMSQHLQWKLVKDMRHKTFQKYAAVWRAPSDLVVLSPSYVPPKGWDTDKSWVGPDEGVTILWPNVIEAVALDPMKWVVPQKPYGDITDRLAVLGLTAANHYDNMLYHDLIAMFFGNVNGLSLQQVLFQPEQSLHEHMAMNPKLKCQMYDIPFRKCIYTHLQNGKCRATVEPSATRGKFAVNLCPSFLEAISPDLMDDLKASGVNVTALSSTLSEKGF